MIFSILSRAILDLFGSAGATSHAEEMEKTRSDALTFLTQETGAWARRRKELCEMVGMDSDLVRRRVVRVLEGDSSALDTYEGRGDLTHIDEARVFWEYEKDAPERARIAAEKARRVRKLRSHKPKATHAPKVKAAISSRADVAPIVFDLLTKPHKFKDLIIATGGDVSEHSIRNVLRSGTDDGSILRRTDGTYVLASVPEVLVEAVAG